MDRTKTQAWGLFGAGKGARGGIFVKKKGDERFRTFSEAFGTISDSKFTRVVLKQGDEVMIQSPGGGGYGSPAERLTEAIEEDIRQGWVSPEAARDFYGYKS
jgi:N-methylhydantoinase B/oxoprolinase/acetone carboxylase alpha subunit